MSLLISKGGLIMKEPHGHSTEESQASLLTKIPWQSPPPCVAKISGHSGLVYRSRKSARLGQEHQLGLDSGSATHCNLSASRVTVSSVGQGVGWSLGSFQDQILWNSWFEIPDHFEKTAVAQLEPGPGDGSTCPMQSPQPHLQPQGLDSHCCGTGVDIMLLSIWDSLVTFHCRLFAVCWVMTASRTAKPWYRKHLTVCSLLKPDFSRSDTCRLGHTHPQWGPRN